MLSSMFTALVMPTNQKSVITTFAAYDAVHGRMRPSQITPAAARSCAISF